MQEFDSDLAAYVREELLSEQRRAPRRIPAGISGTDTYVRTDYNGQRYDYGRRTWVQETREYKLTRKLGIVDFDRGRVPFDVALALRAPEMSVEDAMIASIDGEEYELVCNGFYDGWSHDWEEMTRELVMTSLPIVADCMYATGEDEVRDEESDADPLDPLTELVKTSEVKRQRNWERRMLLKRRVRRYARHTGSPKPQKHRKAA